MSAKKHSGVLSNFGGAERGKLDKKLDKKLDRKKEGFKHLFRYLLYTAMGACVFFLNRTLGVSF